MSTKRLSKTVIEGGRYGRNKFERRNSHVEVRAQERDYLKAVLADREHAEEYDIDGRQPVYKGFTDKLAPMYRWLEAQVGRSWDEVRSEVFQKFDTRTTAGRHITFDHLLREVVDTESGFDKYGRIIDPEIPTESDKKGHPRYYGFSDYYVDQSGILRGRPDRNARTHYEKVTEQDYRDAQDWLANRMVMEKGGKLFWLCSTEDIWMASWFDPLTKNLNPSNTWGTPRYPLCYYVLRTGEYEIRMAHYDNAMYRYNPFYSTIKTSGDHWEKVENPYSFRQRGELNAEEVKAFRSLKRSIRQDILSFGKGR